MIPSSDDPRILSRENLSPADFSTAVSVLKFGTTYKKTDGGRFPLSLNALASLKFNDPPTILDVGASDGSTSAQVIEALQFSKYFVTDLNPEVFAQVYGGKTYFYGPTEKCLLIASRAWIVYEPDGRAIPPFGSLARLIFRHAPTKRSESRRIELINPALRSKLSKGICVKKYDVMKPWEHQKPDLVIAANVLNRMYFSDEQLKMALRNLIAALNEHGHLALIENRDIEKATIFRIVRGRAKIVQQVNGGSEIESLVSAI